MKNLLIKILNWMVLKLENKAPNKKTIKYRFLEILKNRGASKRKDLINYILMAQKDTKNNIESAYDSLMYKDVSRGYYGTNLCVWDNDEGIIEKDDNGYYIVSKIGLEYLINPKSLKYSKLHKKAELRKRNGDRMGKELMRIHNSFGTNDVWESLIYWKRQGFRKELTSDKRYYLDCLIGFVEEISNKLELKHQLGKDYKID